jgi:archaeal chaperonin
MAISVKPAEKVFLKKVAATSMASKLVAENKSSLPQIAVEAVCSVAQKAGDKTTWWIWTILWWRRSPVNPCLKLGLLKGWFLTRKLCIQGMPKRV